MVIDVLALLKQRMVEKTPTLFLGAGFSASAKNGKKEDLLIGSTLSDNLYKHFYVENPLPEMDSDYILRAEKLRWNLKELCRLLRTEGRLIDRNSFLTDRFKGCVPSDKGSAQQLITSYPWERIFSLNIDDLVENIYSIQKKELFVWNFKESGSVRRKPNSITLFKLHGDVNDPNSGYIFDNDEYRKFIVDGSCLQNEFADAYTDGDIIFVGTEFQEDDLQEILQKYTKLGYKSDGNHYFFVSPKINDLSFENTLKSDSTPNFHWIKMNTEEFFTFVKENITINREMRHYLRVKGACFFDEIIGDIPTPYMSDLYTGVEPIVDDFIEEWDVPNPHAKSLYDDVIGAGTHRMVCIYGNSYVGKTCVALKLLTVLMQHGYTAINFSLCTIDVIRILEQYLKSLERDTKIAFVFEDASFYYEDILKLLKTYDDDRIKIAAITVDAKSNFESKNYVLHDSIYYRSFLVEENINEPFASNIYDTLNEKGRLGQYQQFLGVPADPNNALSKRKVVQEIVKFNDIIEALYFAEEGRGFQAYFSDYLKGKASSINYRYLCAMALIEQLGINRIAIRVLANLFSSKNFDMDSFEQEYRDIINIKHGKVKMRCMRIIQGTLGYNFKTTEISDILTSIVVCTLGQFQERDINEWKELFQKAIQTKKLLKNKILDIDAIYKLFSSLMQDHPSIKNISYFWVQFGVAAQEKGLYEEANSYLLNAKRIRPNAYQVEHAIAKNWMERGLYEIENIDYNTGKNHFIEGKKIMKSMIESGAFNFRRALRYTVHTYTDLLIKYSILTRENLDETEYAQITALLIQLCRSDKDKFIHRITDRFSNFCYTNSKVSFYKELQNVLQTTRTNYVSDEDYDVSNWID